MAFWNFQDTRYTQARRLTIFSIVAVVFAAVGLFLLFWLGNGAAPEAAEPAVRVPPPSSPPEPSAQAPSSPAPSASAPFALALKAIEEKNFAEAEIHLEQSIAQGQHVDEARSFLGVILKENGKYSEAIEVLNRGIAQNPQANRFFNRGECYEALGETARAKTDFDHAVEKSPGNSLFANKRYLFLIRSGEQAEVEKAINFQLDLGVTQSNNTWVMAAAAIALKQGKPEIAATILTGATQLLTRQDFDYLLEDPLFQEHRMEPAIRSFFQ